MTVSLSCGSFDFIAIVGGWWRTISNILHNMYFVQNVALSFCWQIHFFILCSAVVAIQYILTLSLPRSENLFSQWLICEQFLRILLWFRQHFLTFSLFWLNLSLREFTVMVREVYIISILNVHDFVYFRL